MTIITKRISAVASGGQTKRVASSGSTAASASSIGTDTWGRTWGGAMTSLSSWGRTWFYGTEASGTTPASPAVSVTARVSGVPAGGHTKRVTL